LLLIGYFEGLDAERAIAWRAADSFALRECLGVVLPDAPGPFDDLAHPAPDRSRDAQGRLYLDAAAAGGSGLELRSASLIVAASNAGR
jgi:hypothetical protein